MFIVHFFLLALKYRVFKNEQIFGWPEIPVRFFQAYVKTGPNVEIDMGTYIDRRPLPSFIELKI